MSRPSPWPRLVETSSVSPLLLLVPTAMELDCLTELGGFEPGSCIVKLCGFGPIAAAARTADLLAALRPARVMLLGLAGTYDAEQFPIGSALEFAEVAIDGLGAGEAARFRGPTELGFPQWEDEGTRARIFDRIALDTTRPAGRERKLLLSVCATSDTPAMAGNRRTRYPLAAAEDMEGFGVALACAHPGAQLRIVRGISNVAGDRDPAHWRVREALASAREIALSIARRAAAAEEEG